MKSMKRINSTLSLDAVKVSADTFAADSSEASGESRYLIRTNHTPAHWESDTEANVGRGSTVMSLSRVTVISVRSPARPCRLLLDSQPADR